MSFLNNAALRAALAALFAAVGIEIATPIVTHIVEADSAILAVIGIVMASWTTGSASAGADHLLNNIPHTPENWTLSKALPPRSRENGLPADCRRLIPAARAPHDMHDR